ncbi:glycoside hydrolase family 3 C-terminal domain-containing protein [Pseudomonas fluorescens]|uniref:beta-glucosidase n=2 Tax=Pseudomonas fluorescens TaxID=294 RepID=A0A944HBU5_PSEFL|nr:glycoside hydrolase family 3 C-terminal domain-containing protein [Pseudomonas fluorescens]MBT2309895.1 glycoside hydrolase family 3 C-terminal domain-containing protein [Pseudomonas fluorescens]MBT2315450.1 glycoside hydrolase family 3 C-terminal domain-containing protein [Pseudomonas fluorescens]MBT2315518.1 glycoside hydrolase family 3 C-terminal domain-containing protein [Pseudomonas fluorescens]MBT2328825.1 glycoside hydrolase family 3 C-terminal domain-containing protein [Pseudomonas f
MDCLRVTTAAMLATLSVIIWFHSTAQADEPPRKQQEAVFIERLLGQMTLEEKVGQLTQLGMKVTPTGPVVDTQGRQNIGIAEVGSLLGVYGAEQTRQLQREAVQNSRLHIPLLFSFDVIHGFRTVFPVPLAEASAWDPDLSQRTARAAAVEATASGLHWTFAPMVDIARDPRWGRVVEGAGEDPFLGAALAASRVRGFRGTGFPDTSTILSTAKHFVGYGAAEGGRDYNTTEMSQRTLREVYLPPFHAAVQAGVDTIMPGFNEIDSTPMHADRTLLKGTLRDEWGFQGLVISDYNGVVELMHHGVASTTREAARLAFRATVDIDMVGGAYAAELPVLVRSGQLPPPLLDDAVRRVLQTKQRLGLFEDPYRYSDPAREKALTLSPQTRALAREAAQKSIVLLKNDGFLLPLPKNMRKLVVVGALANNAPSTLGSWPAAGRADESITVLEGIKRAVTPATDVVYIPGASPESNDISGIGEALRVASDADVVVAVIGETADMSGEARSRASLDLPGAQNALVTQMQSTGKPVVVVLMNGRPLAIPALDRQVPAIIEAWFLGSEMGHAVADVLFGDVNPSGKLPITFPRAVGQIPLYHAHKSTGRPPHKSKKYTSKYFDEEWTPLYPFGHGLSYTTFTYGAPKLSKRQLTFDETLTVQVEVRNSGQRTGEETVQLYLRQNVASITRPVRTLRGFSKVRIAPGETQTVEFSLDQDDFALLGDKLLRFVEMGTFQVFVGGSSSTENGASFEVMTSAQLPGQHSAIPRLLRESARR